MTSTTSSFAPASDCSSAWEARTAPGGGAFRLRLSRTLSLGALALSLVAGCGIDVQGEQPLGSNAASDESGFFEGEPGGAVTEPGEEFAQLDAEVLGAGGAGAEFGTGDLTVLMVVDRSGSMSSAWDGPTKWDVVRGALDHAIVGVEEELTIGTLFFPLGQSCNVSGFEHPEQIRFQSGARYQARLRELALWPSGGTPLLSALQRANEVIEAATMEGLLEQRFRVVLMTDGEPTCDGSPDEMVALTDQWRELGVDVRVLGFPGSENARILLDRLAGKEVQEGEPWTPPSSVVDTGSNAADQGYVAPEDADDVDDSVYRVVR